MADRPSQTPGCSSSGRFGQPLAVSCLRPTGRSRCGFRGLSLPLPPLAMRRIWEDDGSHYPRSRRPAMAAFPTSRRSVRRPRIEEPAGVPLLQREPAGGRQDDEGPSPLQRGLLAHDAGHGRRSVRAGHDAAALGRQGRDSVDNAIHRVRVGLRIHGEAGRPFFCFHDRDIAPEGRTLAESNRNLDAVVKIVKEEIAADRHQAALGHGQLVQQSALHARRGHQPQRRRLRLRRRAGEEGAGSDQGTGRRRLRVLGRPRRLPDPLEHRHEARGRPPGPLHAHGGRLRQADRLSPASSISSPSRRSRPSTSTISTRPPASTSSAPTAWPTT